MIVPPLFAFSIFAPSYTFIFSIQLTYYLLCRLASSSHVGRSLHTHLLIHDLD